MAHKRKRCKHCKTNAMVATGVQLPAGFFCTFDHAVFFAQDQRIKNRHKAEETRLKATHKAARESRRTDLSWQHKRTQAAFNKLRVLEEKKWFKERGLVPTCISCNQPKGRDQWACGHYVSRGASGALRYDRLNTYLQHNHRCNMHLSGDRRYANHKRIHHWPVSAFW